jgi:hypothetical protein
MKNRVLASMLVFSAPILAQLPPLGCKGSKKVRIETTSYNQADSTHSTQVLYFDPKGSVVKTVTYDAANEPLEQWMHSYKYDKEGKIKSSQSKFKDFTKQLKPQKFKSAYSYNNTGKLLKVENMQNQSGYECLYDSVGNLVGSSDYNSKGFFGGAKFTWKEGRIWKQKYEWSNKPPESTEYFYDASGRRIKTITSRGQKVVRREVYTYID